MHFRYFRGCWIFGLVNYQALNFHTKTLKRPNSSQILWGTVAFCFQPSSCKAERNINYACCSVLGTKGGILHLITRPYNKPVWHMATHWTMLQNRICAPDRAPQALIQTPECIPIGWTSQLVTNCGRKRNLQAPLNFSLAFIPLSCSCRDEMESFFLFLVLFFHSQSCLLCTDWWINGLGFAL